MPDDPRVDALRALTAFLVTDRTVEQSLNELATIAVDAVDAATMAGIAMHDEKGADATRVFTDQATVAIDAAQYETGRGPCLDAWRTGQVVLLDDLGAHDRHMRERYAEFVERAEEHGVRSTISLPMLAAGQSIGALNLYATRPHGFDGEAETVLTDIAAAAAVVLANVAAYSQSYELNLQLQEAIKGRASIEQAKGILMAGRRGTSPDQAFAMLREASQRENVKLRIIAQRIVDGASGVASSGPTADG